MANGTWEDLKKILHSVPGVKEKSEWFVDRCEKRTQRLIDMGMNEKDAKEIGWIFTFHETEDPSVYQRFKDSKGDK